MLLLLLNGADGAQIEHHIAWLLAFDTLRRYILLSDKGQVSDCCAIDRYEYRTGKPAYSIDTGVSGVVSTQE